MNQFPLLDVPAFTILDACDAYDAVDISKPEGFENGVIAVLLDHQDRPVVALCIDGANPNDLDPIVDFLAEARTAKSDSFSGVVLGLFSPTSTLTPETHITLSQETVSEWELVDCVLGGHGIALMDIVVVDPNGWFAWSESYDLSDCVVTPMPTRAHHRDHRQPPASHPSMRTVS